jgi:hypothetical protein
MKAISAPGAGVDAVDRAERGLGPLGTLGCRSSFASLRAQGARGAVVVYELYGDRRLFVTHSSRGPVHPLNRRSCP